MATNVTQLLNMRQRAVRDHLESGVAASDGARGIRLGGVYVRITIGVTAGSRPCCSRDVTAGFTT